MTALPDNPRRDMNRLAQFHPELLSPERRLHRIAEILCDAILQDKKTNLAGEGPRSVAPQPTLAEKPTAPLTEEQRVVDYLSRVGDAPPMAIRAVLRLSRTTTYRVLTRLVASGRIVVGGNTRALTYRLAPLPPHSQNVEQN